MLPLRIARCHGSLSLRPFAAAADIFYVLQLLIPGMLLIVHDTPDSLNMANYGNGGAYGGGRL